MAQCDTCKRMESASTNKWLIAHDYKGVLKMYWENYKRHMKTHHGKVATHG